MTVPYKRKHDADSLFDARNGGEGVSEYMSQLLINSSDQPRKRRTMTQAPSRNGRESASETESISGADSIPTGNQMMMKTMRTTTMMMRRRRRMMMTLVQIRLKRGLLRN